MKQTGRKTLSWLLTLAMLLGMVPAFSLTTLADGDPAVIATLSFGTPSSNVINVGGTVTMDVYLRNNTSNFDPPFDITTNAFDLTFQAVNGNAVSFAPDSDLTTWATVSSGTNETTGAFYLTVEATDPYDASKSCTLTYGGYDDDSIKLGTLTVRAGSDTSAYTDDGQYVRVSGGGIIHRVGYNTEYAVNSEYRDVYIGYPVRFHSDHDTAPATQYVKKGQKATDPGNLSASGYRFDGWYTSADGDDTYSFISTNVNAPTDIYAHWTRLYTLSLGSVANAAVTLTGTGSTITEGGSNSVEAGVTVTVNIEPDGGYETATKTYTPTGGSMTNIGGNTFSMPDANTTVNVTMGKITYSINYNLAEGTGTDALQTYQINDGTTSVHGKPSKTGYVFDYWSVSGGTGWGSTIAAGVSVPENAYGDVTLTAHWSLERYDIHYETSGGTSISDDTYNIDDRGTTTILTAATTTKTGFILDGWMPSGNDGYTWGTTLITNKTIPNTAIGEVTLTAQWSPIHYTIAFDAVADDATGSTASIASVAYNESVNLTANGFSRTGYTFQGWDSDEDGDVDYANEASVTNLTATNNDTVTLYAVWEAESYNITYVYGNGSDNGSGTYTIEGGTLQAAPSKTSYNFTKWKVTSPGTGWEADALYDAEASIASGKSGAVTLTAQWSPIHYTIAFNGNGATGGSMDNMTSVEYGVYPTLTTNGFSRTGYTFQGWATTSNGE